MDQQKFEFRNLTSEVRSLMLAEIALDQEDGVLYLSTRFNEVGAARYPSFLKQAAELFDESWLGQQLLEIDAFLRIDQAGRKVPRNAHIVFSQGEFNRYYIRAVCRLAIEKSRTHVIVYRARGSRIARAESEAKIGMKVEPQRLLVDLRTRIAAPTDFGLPDINSGLCVELVVGMTSPWPVSI